jgi:hypothetical protein
MVRVTGVQRKAVEMAYEYRTTHGDTFSPSSLHQDTQPDDPIQPDDDGWEMCGSAATTYRLYWFWRRDRRAWKGEE